MHMYVWYKLTTVYWVFAIVNRCVAAYINNDLKQPLSILDKGVMATEEPAPYLELLKEDIIAYVLYRVVRANCSIN